MKQDVFEPGVSYHIYNRGNNKENIFKEEKNYAYFINLLEKYILPIADVYAYCLMKNHFHFVLKIKDSEFLDEKYRKKPHLAFSNLFNAYTKAINKMYKRTGSLFQEHIKRKRIENDVYLKQLIAYVHLNPVKHEFIDNFRLYLHSSYKDYIKDGNTFVKSDYIVSLFENLENFEYFHDVNRMKLNDDEF